MPGITARTRGTKPCASWSSTRSRPANPTRCWRLNRKRRGSEDRRPMGAISRRFRLSWPLLVGALAFIPALRAPKGVLGDPDTYFHVVVGRWIMAHGALPTADPFSHTLAGIAWRTHEWLGEVVLAILYDLGGWRAVVLLTASCFAISAALLTRRLLRQSEPVLAVTLSLIAVNLFLPHLLARPHVLVLPILIAFC